MRGTGRIPRHYLTWIYFSCTLAERTHIAGVELCNASSASSMPNASGNALGIDRLVMLLADATKIDDVTAFTPEEL